MIARVMFAAVLVVLLGVARPAAAQEPAPGKKADPTVELLAKLRQPSDWKGEELQFDALIDVLDQKYGVAVLVNEASFGGDMPASPIKMPRGKRLSLATVLRIALAPHQATFLVRKNHIEIVSVPYAIRETKNNPLDGEDDGATPRAPLVSAVYKEKPLNEAVADLAEEYDLTVVGSPQAGDAKTAFVTARLLNVPADNGLELIAAQADLRVVRQGKTYLITNADHANGMFEEKLDKERKKIELERLRLTPIGPLGVPGGLGGLGTPGFG